VSTSIKDRVTNFGVTNSAENVTLPRLKHKTLQVFLKILEGIREGKPRSIIAKKLNLNKRMSHYYFNKLEKMGYIRREVRDVTVFYELTDLGHKILEQKELLLNNKSKRRRVTKKVTNSHQILVGDERFGLFRLHNLEIKFPIIKDGNLWLEREVRLRNWDLRFGRFGPIVVKRTSRSLIFQLPDIVCSDPYEGLLRGFLYCLRFAQLLCDRCGFVLGPPEINRRPHWGVRDPLANYLSQFMNLSVDDEVVLDRSPGRGEIDFLDPSLAKEYLEMPRTVKNLAKLILGMREALVQVAENMKMFGRAMEEHVKLIKSIDHAVNSFKAEASNLADSARKVVEAVEDFKDKILEAYNAVASILANQQNQSQAPIKTPNKDFKFLPPKPVKSTSIQAKLNIKPKNTAPTQIQVSKPSPSSAQRERVCPYFKDDGCTANLSGYPSYISSNIKESYCLSGRHQDCWQYQFYVERYGG